MTLPQISTALGCLVIIGGAGVWALDQYIDNAVAGKLKAHGANQQQIMQQQKVFSERFKQTERRQNQILNSQTRQERRTDRILELLEERSRRQ